MNEKEKTGSIMVTGYKRGHKYSYEWKGLEFHLKNPGPVSEEKSCIKCGKIPTKNGHDACLGNLPGVIAACCGHGITEGHILFENGISIRGNFNIEIPLDDAKNKLLTFLEGYNGDMSPFLLANKLDLNYVLVNTILDELVENKS
jgi:hypothetical protein